MKYHRFSPDLAIAPQLQLDDLDALRDAGFRSIICNRPDGEGAEQPSFHARYLPVVPETIDNGDVLAFEAILAELPVGI
jgi:sulfide:quinone oxidoreductase